MYIAEGLLRRKQLTELIPRLAGRLVANTAGAFGTKPEEPPATLAAKIEASYKELHSLVVAINKTNNTTPVEVKGVPATTLMEALAFRDVLKVRVAEARNTLNHQRHALDRGYGAQEPQKVPFEGIDFRASNAQIDHYSETLRLLETEIQRLGWTTPLIA